MLQFNKQSMLSTVIEVDYAVLVIQYYQSAYHDSMKYFSL